MEPWDQAQAIRLAISSAHAMLTFCLLVLLALAGWSFKYRTVKLKIPLLFLSWSCRFSDIKVLPITHLFIMTVLSF